MPIHSSQCASWFCLWSNVNFLHLFLRERSSIHSFFIVFPVPLPVILCFIRFEDLKEKNFLLLIVLLLCFNLAEAFLSSYHSYHLVLQSIQKSLKRLQVGLKWQKLNSRFLISLNILLCCFLNLVCFKFHTLELTSISMQIYW